MNLKRLWDTENKKAVWAMPAVETQAEIGRFLPLQVWTNDDWSKLYVYSNSQYREIFSAGTTVETYWPVWKELEDETVGYYLTNEPTNLYSWDWWDEAALQNFVLPYWWNTLAIFGDAYWEAKASNYVELSIEEEPETGGKSLSVGTYWLFDNEFFVGTYDEEDQNGWQYIFWALDPEDVYYLIGEGSMATNWEWKSGIWSAFQSYYATPNKANADAVITAIEATRDDVSGKLDPITWTIPPLPTLHNVINRTSETSANVLTDGEGNYIRITIETDVEEWTQFAEVNPVWVFADEKYVQGWFNAWSEIFVSGMDVEQVKSMIGNATEFPEDIFAAMNAFYNNPTLENIQSLASLLQQWNPGGEEPE